METAIQLEGVTKQFGKTRAVDALDLTVPRGSLHGFIGPNGSGKTTTLRMIMNILLPDTGTIGVLGHSNFRAARDRIAYLPEERGLYKRMSVRRLLRYYGGLKGMTQPDLDQQIAQWLDRLGLSDWIEHKIEALSKGMAQKVQLIASVICRPELLILDEPFSGLDPVNAEVLKAAVLDLRREGTTVVFSTHDMSVAERLCDRVFMIFRGKKVLDGTVAEVLDEHGQDRIRVRTDLGRAAFNGLDGVEELIDHGNEQDVRWRGDSQDLLKALLERTPVHHFGRTRPTLHDIFVRIADPDLENDNAAEAASNA